MRKLLSTFAGLLLILLLLPSCSPTDTFHAGRPITKEELASISATLFTVAEEPDSSPVEPESSAAESNISTSESEDADTAAESTVAEADSTETEETTSPNLNQTVYWLKNSKVYHTDPNCHHLAGQLSVKETTLRTAKINGLRPCKDCGNE